ncbi:MAG: response regulator transcription factor [Saprospiraceae bacterium]|nr:response regulator transcription factor [Saprospiraceae bacterium]
MRHLDVLVADNHPIFALGLQAALSDPKFDFSIQISGIAVNGLEVQEMLHQNDPDLLLLDLGLPQMDGLQLLPSVKRNHSKTRILVVSGNLSPKLAEDALEAGADGFMLKTGTKDDLFEAISQIIQGNKFVSSTAQGAEPAPDFIRDFAQKYNLTAREVEILKHIAQAKDNHEIGAQLYISYQTVSVHRKNIMRKLNVNSTASLIKIAFENKLF